MIGVELWTNLICTVHVHKKKPTDIPRVSGPEELEDVKDTDQSYISFGLVSLHQLSPHQRFETEIDRHATPRGQDGPFN